MFNNIFQKVGLSPTQAAILEHLFLVKEDKAGEIAKKIKKSRAIVYRDLEELVSFNVIEKIEKPNQVTTFRIDHPSNLEKFFENKENELKKDREQFKNYLPDLVSSYNAIHNKPGVKFYEGLEGNRKVYKDFADKFKNDTEIISFIKILSNELNQDMEEAFNYFIKRRLKKNVKLRSIALDNAEGRHFKSEDEKYSRETKLIPLENFPFDFPGGEIDIYEDEVYIFAMQNNLYFGLVIQNQAIAHLLRAFFEAQWSLLSMTLPGFGNK